MMKGLVFACLFMVYPYLVYKGMESGLNWLSPVAFSGFFLYQALVSPIPGTRIRNTLFALLLLLGAFYLQTTTAKLLPVFVQIMLMILFGRTLLKDKGPALIDRIVRLQFPESPPAVSVYCRQLTLLWTVFFAGNALLITVLAIWGSGFWWALYNGVMIYVLMGILAIGEYIYRRNHFADLSVLHQGIPDLKATLKAMIINGRKVYQDIKEH